MRYNRRTQQKPGIRSDRTELTLHAPAYPKEISQQYTTATHRSSVPPGGPLRGGPSLSVITKGASLQLPDASTPPPPQQRSRMMHVFSSFQLFWRVYLFLLSIYWFNQQLLQLGHVRHNTTTYIFTGRTIFASCRQTNSVMSKRRGQKRGQNSRAFLVSLASNQLGGQLRWFGDVSAD